MIGRRGLLMGAIGLSAFGAARWLDAGERFSRAGVGFGTTVRLTVLASSAARAERALDAGFAALRAVERAASLFDPASELARLNRDGAIARPSADLVRLVTAAVEMAAASEGAFDPSVQPLWRLKAEAAAAGRAPEPAALAAARVLVDWRAIAIAPGAIALGRPGMALTLNGIAQGHGADRVMAALAEAGIVAALVDTGELGGRGAPWQIALGDDAAPRGGTTDGAANGGGAAGGGAVLTLTDGFLATSGDDQTVFDAAAGEHHIIDPATGRSPRGIHRISVLAPSGLVADGLSTALMVTPAAARAGLARRFGARIVAQA